jgi:hypothetical protein
MTEKMDNTNMFGIETSSVIHKISYYSNLSSKNAKAIKFVIKTHKTRQSQSE